MRPAVTPTTGCQLLEPNPKIIGGMFGLELASAGPSVAADGRPEFLEGRHRLLATARSAFALLHRSLQPRRVWLPSYLCGVILPAFSEPIAAIRFYAIDERLRLADDTWLAEVQPGDLVVFIDYFGFKHWDEWGQAARARGAWVVEDACQALLIDRYSAHAHYVVFSPRKFVGVPDGGILLAQGDAALPADPLSPPPADWWVAALTASIRRAEFDRTAGSEDRSWYQLFQKVEPAGPVAPTAMSELSAFILKHWCNWSEIARRRRANYGRLAEAMREFALFPELPSGVVPLGFPARFANRNVVQSALFAQQIYPSTHWRLRDIVPASFTRSHSLAEQILTIPCDQRYGPGSIRRIIATLRKIAN